MAEDCEELVFDTIEVAFFPRIRNELVELLGKCGLSIEEGVDTFVTCRFEGRLVGCAGLEANIVKCVAIDPLARGECISLKVVSEMIHVAHDLGHDHLFLYTRPNNISFFAGCGFYPIVEVPGLVTLMENTPIGIRSYSRSLARLRRDGATVGGIVINANPFTLGHRYLVEQAAAGCDVLHLFVVAEDASYFPYRDRFDLVREGVEGIPNLVLHPGSEYMISRATFSSYFFKEKNVVGDCFTAVDLLIFREHIAPALGITHRFVGTEPFCRTTNKYNADMKYWLQADLSGAPPVQVVEIERTEYGAVPISASEVRRLLAADDFDRIANLVPPTTLQLLATKYRTPRVSAA
ncbi:MAG: [citrate (pro-3S)-lyase] ligase [Hyphomicrobiales bacterium]|nr:[citrate (pro-3S)-lyase] ligase [Hyphomicrobiales bacterium]